MRALRAAVSADQQGGVRQCPAAGEPEVSEGLGDWNGRSIEAMTETLERRVSHRELTLLAFICKRCKAELTLDIRNEEQCSKLLELHCPFCRADFDSQLRESFTIFRKWRERLGDHEIIFRLPAPPPDPTSKRT